MKHPTELQIAYRALQCRCVRRYRVERGIVFLASGQFEQFGAVLESAVQLDQRADDAVELLFFLAELLRPFLILPYLGILELALDRGEPI